MARKFTRTLEIARGISGEWQCEGWSAQTDLLHERHEVVKEVLFHYLFVVPASDGAKVHVEGLAGRRNLLSVGALHRASHRSCEVCDGTGPISGSDEDLVGPVVEVLVGKRLEKV